MRDTGSEVVASAVSGRATAEIYRAWEQIDDRPRDEWFYVSINADVTAVETSQELTDVSVIAAEAAGLLRRFILGDEDEGNQIASVRLNV